MNNPIRYVILGFAVFLLYVIISIVTNLGVFKDPVVVGERPLSATVVYKEIVGPYYKVGEVFEEVETKLKGLGLKCEKSFGHYLDNPDKVDEDRLRAHIGCFVMNEGLTEKPIGGFKTKKLGPGNFLLITFDGSPAAGPLKIYPKANGWFKQNSHPQYETIIEVYNQNSDGSFLTQYYFPIADGAL